ncbi:putative PAS/PAC sensor protein [Oscillochloris trichoides DG-6]|uniref:PAS/PAC sensor protein n=1 Tax=Oscillochloris trichoides DG-6 TaxID=765420 RepID=E1IH03_9CHLR|nr:HD domain-containing phosphohydrolase [Oscillochloris trichoides]EFO79478.1 putative PAS/PAC sensor protein [Oscillochloris trichoides DG-6]
MADPHELSNAEALTLLARLIKELNTDQSLQSVFDLICHEVALAFQCVAIAGAYDEECHVIRMVRSSGADLALVAQLIPPPSHPAPPQPQCHQHMLGQVECIGLWHDGIPVGALVLLNPARQHQQLFTSIADLTSQAVVHAIRLSNARSRSEDLEVINTLGRALAETLDLERMYRLLYEVAIKLLPDVAGAIFSLFDAQSQQIRCVFAILEGEEIDPCEFPVFTLAPPGKGLQSDTIHKRQPMIVGSFEELNQRSIQVVEVGTDEGSVTESILYVPMIAREQVIGVLQVQSFSPGSFSMAHAASLGMAANIAAVAIENARLVKTLQESNQAIFAAYNSTLEGWSRALDLRDQETQGHSQRVTEMTVRMAHAVGMSEEEITYARWGALLHDIGKMGVPDAILLKPGPLSEEEWSIMRMHPVYAYQLLMPISFLHPALDIPYCHHERWDGSGYPRGLRGPQIPLAARLFAVIDIWDALRSDRPYRAAWPVERVCAHIHALAGNHLDPEAVRIFFQVIEGG